MGIYLNPGNDLFFKAINSPVYVDKTMLIDFTNKAINTTGQNICVSRPRRFGKSMAEHMLVAYYSSGCASGELFRGLKITKTPDYEKYLNKYNVVFINMSDVMAVGRNVGEALDFLCQDIMEELEDEFPEIHFPSRRGLARYLEKAFEKTKVPFIFIIDEWDVVFRKLNLQNDVAQQKEYLDFLRLLFKDKAYVGLAYMTGILPIKKYGEHSALNMFTEYSMTDMRPVQEMTGFTESETRALCETFHMPYEQMRENYDGYLLNGVHLYNPNSVVNAITRGGFSSFWTKTETYEALKKYIVMNYDGLKEAVTELIAGEQLHVNPTRFQNDMTTFEKKDDVLTLLVHLGYLTYDSDQETVWIPNKEVRKEFVIAIEDGGWEQVMAAIQESGKLLDATLNKDEEMVAALVEKAHMENVSIIKYNDENSLACVLSLAYYKARDSYDLYRELPAGKGFADLLFVPQKPGFPALVVELKWNEKVRTALNQIWNREYVEGLKSYRGKVLLVGISYDRGSKKHQVRILEMEKE